MFDAVRNNKRIVQVFLALIPLPFAMWGVDYYVRNSGPGNDVASVGGTKVTVAEFQQAMREQQEQLKQALGPNFNPEMMNSPSVRKAMLDQLVNQRILMLEAKRQGVVVTDAVLADFIANVDAFQEGGKFSLARYQAFVANQGKSQQCFEYGLRQDLVLRQLAGEGMTMIVVTHEMEFARAMADRVLFFDAGVIAEDGPPEQVFTAPLHERTREFLKKVSEA